MVTTKIESALERPVNWLDGVIWLVPGLVAGGIVYYAYLLTHPYPAFGAGLFMAMAEQVSANGYRLPATIPLYAEPIPFAYPPLMFYVVAVLHDLFPFGPTTLSRFLPGLVSLLYLVPFYFFVAELRGSERLAGVATFIVAVSPPVLQWQISAGGIVRAPAMLFLLTGLYTGLRMFRGDPGRWLVPSLALFALTILTHPVYTVFFALSYLWLYATFDRSGVGLWRGAVVGLGGVGVTSPWWLSVIDNHGVDQFTGAAGTHGGIGTQLPELAAVFAPDVVETLFPGAGATSRSAVLINVQPDLFRLDSVGTLLLVSWLVVILGAAIHLLARHRVRTSHPELFLSGWLLLSIVLVSKPRFSFLIGAIITAVALFEYVVPLVNRYQSGARRRHVEMAVIVVIAVAGMAVGTLYASSQLDSHGGSASLPAFVDDEDVEAMEWARAETDSSARFAVVGDAAEWFPYLAERKITVGPWGVEWMGEERYQEALGRYNKLSTCETRECVDRQLVDADTRPEYLYVPTDEYTVRGMETEAPASLREDLVHSERYNLVFWNEGVMVFQSADTRAHREAARERLQRAARVHGPDRSRLSFENVERRATSRLRSLSSR